MALSGAEVRASEVAERALLGALLVEPRRLADVQKWLEPGDFCAHRHALVYTTMLELRADGAAPTPRAVLGRILPDPGSRRSVDGPFLHTLMESCPHPAYAAGYGRMVLEASIHRRTGDRAGRLDYVAHSEAPSDVVFDELEREAVRFADELRSLEHKWTMADGDNSSAGAVELPHAPDARMHVQDAAEVAVVASLLRSPWQYEQVKDWLRPDDFMRKDMRVLYAAIDQTVRHDMPVDHVTVMWTVLRRGAFSKDFTYDVLARLADAGVPGYAAVAAREVLRVSLCRRTSGIARQLAAAAAAPSIRPSTLFQAVQSELQDIATGNRRWVSATKGALRTSAGFGLDRW